MHRLVRHIANPSALPGLIWKNLRQLWRRRQSTPVPARRSVPTERFEAIYARSPDPWNYRTSAYEQDKYGATLAALPESHFRRGFDIGCSIGVLSRHLAMRCTQLLAVDIVDTALAQARETCADSPHVTFARMRIPNEWPDGLFDLIVISEVLYYLDPSDIRRTATACLKSLESRGTIVLVNYLPPNKRPCYADEAVSTFCAALRDRCKAVTGQRGERYRLDVLRAAS